MICGSFEFMHTSFSCFASGLANVFAKFTLISFPIFCIVDKSVPFISLEIIIFSSLVSDCANDNVCLVIITVPLPFETDAGDNCIIFVAITIIFAPSLESFNLDSCNSCWFCATSSQNVSNASIRSKHCWQMLFGSDSSSFIYYVREKSIIMPCFFLSKNCFLIGLQNQETLPWTIILFTSKFKYFRIRSRMFKFDGFVTQSCE